MKRSCQRLQFVLALGSLILPGCGTRQEMATLSGTVMLSGKPLPEADVMLEGVGRLPIMAKTDGAGTFSLKAPPGSYKVAISKTKTRHRTGDDPKTEYPDDVIIEFLTPKKYANTATSGYVVEVEPGMDSVTWDMHP